MSNIKTQADEFLSVKAVRARIGVSRTTILEWSKAGRFPKPRRLGDKRVAWLASEVSEWMQSRPAA